jgi:hypothetical protein
MADEIEQQAAVAAAEEPVEEPVEEGGQAEPPWQDLIGRMDTFNQQLGAVEQRLGPGEEPEPQPDPISQLLGGDRQETAQGRQDLIDLIEQRPEDFMSALRDQGRQDMREEIAPLLEEITQQKLADLEDEFPRLGTNDGAQELMGAASLHAQQLRNPNLVRDPGFLRMVHLAQLGEQALADEKPAGADQQTAQLESGGGAPPEPQQNVFERLHENPQNDALAGFFS